MSTTSAKSNGGFRSLAKRYGAKASIIAIGAAVAVGSLENTHFLPKPKLTSKPFAAVLTPKVVAAAKPWSVLDAGVEHDRITYWIGRLTGSSRDGVEETLAKKSKYEQMIAGKLKERQMPADLIYLAMIESNFNPNATSPVKAKGLWQFMSATARQFGLTVRGKTDERTDPSKATDAALTYLQQLKDRFGSWYLAAAAYNSGGGTVSKALRKTTGKTTGTDSDFFRILPNLPKETQDYVPKLIATARVGNNPEKYGLKVQHSAGEVALPAKPAASASTDSVAVSTAPSPGNAKSASDAVAISLARKTVIDSTTHKADSSSSAKAAPKATAKSSSARKASSSRTRKASVRASTTKKSSAKKPSAKKPVARKPVRR